MSTTYKATPATVKAADTALAVQDACNLSGVAIAFVRHMKEMQEEQSLGTDARNRHPVIMVFLDKLNHLALMQEGAWGARLNTAYDAVNELKQGKDVTLEDWA